jgi:hypothetical protein
MKKKVSKPNALKVFNDNKAAAYKKAGGAMKDFKKSLPKAQTGKQTPFQSYMKTPGAVASDTVMKTLYPGSSWDAPKKPIAKNPKNQGTLEKAYEKTYGQNWRSESGQPASDETFEQYKRRMGPMKKGGSTKMAVGGTKDSDCWPGKPGCGAERARRVNKRRRFWNSDTGKTVKKVGAGVAAAGAGAAAYAKNLFGAKDAVKGLMEQKKGGTVKRKK